MGIGSSRSAARCRSFTEVIAQFPSFTALADALNIPISTVRSWSVRNSIPVGYWHDLVLVGHTFGVKHLTLHRLNAIIKLTEEKNGGKQRHDLRS